MIMKNFFKNKKWTNYILTGIFALNIIFYIIILSMKVTLQYGGLSAWQTATLYKKQPLPLYFCTAFNIFFIVDCIIYLGSLIILFWKNKKWGFYLTLPFNFIFSFLLLFVHIYYNLFHPFTVFCIIVTILLMIGSLVLMVLSNVLKIKSEEDEEDKIEKTKVPFFKASKNIILILNTLSMVLLFSVFLIPLYSNSNKNYILISTLFSATYDLNVYISFISIFIICFASFMYYLTTITYYFKADNYYIKKSKNIVNINLGITIIFFLIGFFTTFYFNINKKNAITVSYIPFLLMMIESIVLSFVQGKYLKVEEVDFIKEKNKKKFKIEPLFYVFIFTLIIFISLFFNIVEIKFNSFNYSNNIKLTGYQLLSSYGSLGSGYQLLAFILFAFLTTSVLLFVLTLISYLGKNKDYYKLIKISVYTNLIFMFILGLSGYYFKISQKVNEDNIKSLLEQYNLSLPVTYTYTIKSQMLYVFMVSLVVLIIMIARKQLNHTLEEENISKEDFSNTKEMPLKEKEENINSNIEDFDACPAFSELDSKKEMFEKELNSKKESLFENPTLPNLVRFIVDYARESRLHLSYTLEDIATFVAGLGASRLTILQGMSGTGKTSLPKIFTEAIMGNCEIVEVESSWRDKNELIGYYNEFSKSFTPKKFTQCLYKAKLNPEVPTFIVLDEMNLSRIEYYFSDFLSLMEHEENKREIKLLNVKLYRTENNVKHSYLALTDNHTIKIPTNVWFIGTANKDESTFEISDKVYDRAQTMNFNKRAPKIHSFSQEIPPKFLPYETFKKLLDEAKQNTAFDAEGNIIIQGVEKILAPYNISFGNRVLKQMEEFVSIYCACFGDKDAVLNEAIEKILLSKVVSKLEVKVVENKEKLALEFDKLGLEACSAFVRKLNED